MDVFSSTVIGFWGNSSLNSHLLVSCLVVMVVVVVCGAGGEWSYAKILF